MTNQGCFFFFSLCFSCSSSLGHMDIVCILSVDYCLGNHRASEHGSTQSICTPAIVTVYKNVKDTSMKQKQDCKSAPCKNGVTHNIILANGPTICSKYFLRNQISGNLIWLISLFSISQICLIDIVPSFLIWQRKNVFT